MQYLTAALTFILVLLVTLPPELYYKRNVLRNVLVQNHQASSLYVKHDSKVLEKLIGLSRGMRKFIPMRISDKSYEKIQKTLLYAGIQNKITVEDFVGLKYALAFLCILYPFFLFLLYPTETMFLLVVAAAFMGYMIPNNWASSKAKKRQWSIQKDVPSILSSLAIVTDAGLNLLQAIEEVTKRNNGDLGKELKKTLEDLKIGIPQKDAFEKLAERCNVEEVSLFVSALVQGLEKGSSGLTTLIREQAKESWEKRKHKAKELAEKASMKLFMPLLLLVLPAFLIFLMGPMVFSLVKMFK